MRYGTLLGCVSALAFASVTAASAQQLRGDAPNILLLVADDMGYADIGAYGGEIPTPNIDALAEGGVMFTDFHANATCAASRAMLMTGVDNHLAGIGRQRSTPHAAKVRAGYERVLSHRNVTLPEMLRDAGYRTMMAGKWHLGDEWERQPQNRGFDESAVILEGAGAHFPQKVMGIRADEADITFMHDGKMAELPADYYSTRYFTDQIIDSIGDGSDAAPFFAYAAFTSPHWPLQAPDEDLATFRGKYDDGWEALAAARIARQKELGLLPADYPAAKFFERTPEWDDLDANEKARASREMEAYAAMVSNLDREIGRIVAHLKEIGEYDHTLILFMSDNGAEGARRTNQEWVKAHFDNSLENIGRVNSFVTYGPGWAQAGMITDRLFKVTPYDGGTHVPAIIHMPGTVSVGRTDAFAHVTDIFPTLLELAGVEEPGIRYDGRDVFPLQGSSMMSMLTGTSDVIHSSTHVMGHELHGEAYLRRGNWQIVHDPKRKSGGAWQLYDLSVPSSLREDLSQENPEVLDDMLLAFREWATVNNVGVGDGMVPRDVVYP